jgi:signal transduction histidine kinase
MQRLIGRMLSLARAESGQQILDFAPTDVAALLHTLTETLAPQAEAKQITIQLHAAHAATIVSDADSLTQILLNLVENAIAYTDVGLVDITLAPQPNGICIVVSDSGRGIEPNQLPLIFEPFYRADPARQRQNGGVGLGLALAYELTHLLGGELTAANRSGGGAVFTLTLPAGCAAIPTNV